MYNLPSVPPKQLSGKRLVLFSYGSGLAAAMYSLRVSTDFAPKSPLASLSCNVSDIPGLLTARRVVSPPEFEAIMKLREETHHKAPYEPQGNASDLFPSTFYLTSVDDKHRRTYGCVGVEDGTTKTVTNGTN